MNILVKTKKDYNTIASHFSEKRRFIWEDIKPFLKLVKQKDKVLDIGCGNGRLYGALKEKNIEYLGIDFSEELIKIARKKYSKACFKLADITKEKTWKYPCGFDACFCIAVLHHIPSKKLRLRVLQNIYKALKKNGFLFLTIWNMYQEKYKKYFKNKKQKDLLIPYKISNGEKIIKQVDRYVYAFEKKELEELIKKAGFTIKQAYCSGFNLCFAAKKMVK